MEIANELKEDKRFYAYWTLTEALFWCNFRLTPMWEDMSLYGGERFRSHQDLIDWIKISGFSKKTWIKGECHQKKIGQFPDGFEYIEKPYGRVERIYNETEELRATQKIWLENFRGTFESPKQELFLALYKGQISARGLLTNGQDNQTTKSIIDSFNDFDVCKEMLAEGWDLEKIRWADNAAVTKYGEYKIIHVSKYELLQAFPYSDNSENQPLRKKVMKVVSTAPVISPTVTETWKEDVQMAVNHYYNKNNVAPVPKKLCQFIQNQKEKNEEYAKHIKFIHFKKPLQVIKDSLYEMVGWDTFGKEVGFAKNRLKL